MVQTPIFAHLEQIFTTWALYFFAYAFIGWLWESGYVSVRKRRWVNSGFLNGPIIPVYGVSVTAVLVAIRPFKNNWLLVYLTGVVLITAIEYATSWLMEKLFNARWWDYSKVPLNINGRVAIPISAFWGVGVVLLVRFVQPIVVRVIAHIAGSYGIFAAITLLTIAAFDFGFTLANVLAFGAATKRIGEAIATTKAELADMADDATAKLAAEHPWLEELRVRERKHATLPRLNFEQRRLLHSFPNLRVHGTETPAKDIAALVDQLKKKQAK